MQAAAAAMLNSGGGGSGGRGLRMEEMDRKCERLLTECRRGKVKAAKFELLFRKVRELF
jgi:hypothetical protein